MWHWTCNWEAHEGIDRSCCPAHSRQGSKTKESAQQIAREHERSTRHYGKTNVWYSRRKNNGHS
jgi:hypothetical protein